MSTRDRVLLADDDPLSRDFLAEALQSFGCDVMAVTDGRAAIEAMTVGQFDFVVTDLRMPHADGMEVMAASKSHEPDRPVVLVTAHGTMHVAVAAMREGAADVLEKPVELDALEAVLERIRERRRLMRENTFLREEAVGGDLVVASKSMRDIVDMVSRVAKSTATVLVRGESGTGKERVAALVHKCSDRSQRAFVKLNCAAMSESLLESELFGHEAGSFTGAGRRRAGRFELADGGTLFLDEVGEMSPSMQAKLLRVLQEGEFERVGGNQTLRVDVRVVAATNRDLDAEVEAGRFRGDLLYRLNVVPICLSPLRERPEDIVPLARHFLGAGLEFEPEAEQVLAQWHWPGNVRELQNLVQRVGLMCDGRKICPALVRQWLQPQSAAAEERVVVLQPADPLGGFVGRSIAEVERELIQRTLDHCGGNRKRTAEKLGIGVRTLFNKLKEPAFAVGGDTGLDEQLV
ncbi:sigma-54 dependent transcriptional regulator [bacterium]|jgi:two-component system, NtrC family, response regulator HydG|nr:sigma-54 dependent transcriptional regulator [bacterium]